MEQVDIQETKSVIVSNISPSANEKTVSDFFSFCGKISKLFLKKEDGKDTSAAVIQFETESAAKTALLLTNALIVDRPISVLPYVGPAVPAQVEPSSPVPEFGTPVDGSKITQRDFGNVSDDQRSKTSVVASLLAAGYTLANDALDKAKDFDHKHSFSQKAQHAVDVVKVKAQEIDTQYGITNKANAMMNSIETTAKKIDSELHLSERANQAAQAIKQTAQSGLQKAQENPTVKKGVESMKNTAQKVTQTYNDVKEQTKNEIENKKREKEGSAPAPVVNAQPTATAPPVVPSEADPNPTGNPQ